MTTIGFIKGDARSLDYGSNQDGRDLQDALL